MSAMPHEFDLAHATMLPPADTGPRAAPNIGILAAQWEAVHEAAAAVSPSIVSSCNQWLQR